MAGTTHLNARRPRTRWGSALALLMLAGLLAGCGAGAPSATPHSTSTVAPTTTVPTTTTTTVPPTTTTTEQPGWSVVGSDALGTAVDSHAFTGPGGGVVTVLRFRAGTVTYALHAGSEDPPGAAAVASPDSGPTIGPDEAPLLLAAFNGGFKMAAGAGGFELGGHVVAPLQPGLASLVIDVDGTAHVGIWGQDVPAPGEAVSSVRQNLAPLVAGGAPNASAGDVAAWGATLGGGSAVARSALGVDAQGDLLYAGGASLTPADLAAGLVDAGAITAMELDINPEWVQADAAPTPGAPLAAVVPGQSRPADQYQVGWTRDFVTVLARP